MADPERTPDTPLCLSRKGKFVRWLIETDPLDIGKADERIAAAYPAGVSVTGEPVGPDREGFTTFMVRNGRRLTEETPETRGPRRQRLLEKVFKMPGCSLSARQLGLGCQKRRPPDGHKYCDLGKHHAGDCRYPKREVSDG